MTRWLAALVAMCALAPPEIAQANDWLTIRRGGEKAILDAARSAQATKPWRATYRFETSEKPQKTAKKRPVVEVNVSWRALPAVKGQPVVHEAAVVFDGLPGGRAGVAVRGDKVWVRWQGKPVAAAKGEELVAPLPGVGGPLLLFAALALTPQFDVKLEGEFGGTAVLRLTGKYAGLQGLGKCKLGVSKQSRFAEMAEVGVGDRKDDVKLAWIDIREVRGQLIPDGARLMRPDGTTIGSLRRVGLKLGTSAKGLRFGKDALR